MYFVYSLLLTLAFLVLLPHFLIDAIRHGKYVAGFRERLGKLAPFDNRESRLFGFTAFPLVNRRLRGRWCRESANVSRSSPGDINDHLNRSKVWRTKFSETM